MQREKLRAKYRGQTADSYEATRKGTDLWEAQQNAVEAYLDEFPAGTRVLDAPVGTGRFLRAYDERGFAVVGVDASSAMLDRARAKSPTADLRVGDIFQLDFPSGSFDLVVCIRFLNWLNPRDAQRAFAELARVSKGAVLVNVKTFAPLRELGLKRALRQCRRRLIEASSRDGNVAHGRNLVPSLVNAHGLTVVGRVPVAPADDLYHGLQNHVYLMKKTVGTLASVGGL